MMKCRICGKRKENDYVLYANGICKECFKKKVEKSYKKMLKGG